jgi:hypothetical protein
MHEPDATSASAVLVGHHERAVMQSGSIGVRLPPCPDVHRAPRPHGVRNIGAIVNHIDDEPTDCAREPQLRHVPPPTSVSLKANTARKTTGCARRRHAEILPPWQRISVWTRPEQHFLRERRAVCSGCRRPTVPRMWPSGTRHAESRLPGSGTLDIHNRTRTKSFFAGTSRIF